MVEAPLAFFQVQPEGVLRHAAELGESSLGEAVLAVANAKMLSIAHVHQSIVAAPAVRMNDLRQPDAAANNGLKCAVSRVWDDLGVDSALLFEDTEDNRLVSSSSTALPRTRPRAEVALVHLHVSTAGEGSTLTSLGQTTTDLEVNVIGGARGKPSQFGSVGGRQVQREAPHELAELRL